MISDWSGAQEAFLNKTLLYRDEAVKKAIHQLAAPCYSLVLTSPQTALSVAHARKEMVKLALTGEGKVSSSTKRGVDGAKRKAVRGGEERIEISHEHRLKLTRLGWIRSYSQRTKARFRRRTFHEPNLIHWIKYMKSSASESIRNACFNLERLSRSFRLARPEISPLDRLWNVFDSDAELFMYRT